MKNCYEACLKMYELSDKLEKLLSEKQNAKRKDRIDSLDREITAVENEFLTIKHKLQIISY